MAGPQFAVASGHTPCSGHPRMKRSLLPATILLAVAAARQEPDPTYGDPGGILGRTLPNETTTGGSSGGASGPFPSAYDANANKPTTSLETGHTGGKGPAAADNLDCMDCHKNGGTGPAFSFGGRIFDGATAVADADVIVVQGTTNVGPVKSDAQGFFWSPGAPLADGAKTFVRKGTNPVQLMGGALTASTGGGCTSSSGCHGASNPGKIHI